jgi:predicted nuclease of predicted toxin-antitoxin system
MRFLIDANLSYKLARVLESKGFEILHTDDLPNKERTTENELRKLSVDQDFVVITKDSDFLDSHLIQGIPSKLLIVTTGNITNKDLLSLFDKYFEATIKLFDIYNLIELNNDQIIGHEK